MTPGYLMLEDFDAGAGYNHEIVCALNILFDKEDHLIKLVIDNHGLGTLHCPIEITTYTVRHTQRYW